MGTNELHAQRLLSSFDSKKPQHFSFLQMNVEVNQAESNLVSDTAGNGLFATKDFEGGDVIIRVKSPYVLIPENQLIPHLCYGCLSEKENLNRCTGCKVVKYCSKRCQTGSWKDIHKLECKIFRKSRDEGHPIFPTPVRALIQMLLRQQSGIHFDPSWAHLKTHKEDFMIKEEVWGDIKLQALAALQYSGMSMAMMDVATSILCALKVNAFNATEPDDTPIGLCFEPLFAKANHSCIANAFISFDGRRVSFKALKHIRKGEEITIYYIDTNQPLEERQRQLGNNYHFKCGCQKCAEDWDVYTTFLNNPCRQTNEFWMFSDYEKVEDKAQNTDDDDIKRIGDNYESVTRMVTKAVREDTHKKTYDSLRLALEILGDLSNSKSIAVAPYPTILNALIHNYRMADEIEAALLLLLTSVFYIQPYEFPEPWHPVRVTKLRAVASLMSEMLASPKYGLQRLAVIPPHTISEVELFPCACAVMLLVAAYAPRSHGASPKFTEEVHKDLVEIHSFAKEQGHTDILAMLRLGIRQGSGRVIAAKYFSQLERLADIDLMYKIIETVHCTRET